MILPVDKRGCVALFGCGGVYGYVAVFINKVAVDMCVYYYVIVRGRISAPITCNGEV